MEKPDAASGRNPQLVRGHLLRSNQSALQVKDVDSASGAHNRARALSLDERLDDLRIVDAREVLIALGVEEIPQDRRGVHIGAAKDAEPIVAAPIYAVVVELMATRCSCMEKEVD